MFVVALAGHPNCGKTALFNSLTGGRQKVGNYAGVTVEKKEALLKTAAGASIRVVDLPGTYSLEPRSLDEEITRDVLFGRLKGEAKPDAVVAVADAGNLERGLALVVELRELGVPIVLALNMMDLARGRGLAIDLGVLERELGVPVVATVAVKKVGTQELLDRTERLLQEKRNHATASSPTATGAGRDGTVRARFAEVDRVLALAVSRRAEPSLWTQRIDRVVLHPVMGPLLLLGVLALVFQAVFSWASVPQDLIDAGVKALQGWVGGLLADGPLKSLLVDGVLAGVGAVVVFLPQILILFLFILLLEDSGYMARAAFLMDRAMSRVGLHGRAFIPLLSSFACAIPGIMAARTIENRRDRLATIFVAPLMTCSARIPVYALLIGAFIPERQIFGFFGLRGLVMLGLYAAGVLAALSVAWLLRKTALKGPDPTLLLEMPTYKIPSPFGIANGLYERAKLFLNNAGTVILALSIVLWFLVSYPAAPQGAPGDKKEPAIHYSYAGRFGHFIEPAIKPLGFDWRVGVALVPGFAAREVMVGALATVYAIESAGGDDAMSAALGERLAKDWSLGTALSLLVWFVFGLQCLSTVAVVKRETNGWAWPAAMLVAMTAMAYVASLVTYQASRWMGWA